MKEHEYIALQQQFDAYLERKHLKSTEERQMILKTICGLEDHFDVNMLFDELQKGSFVVSRATIYNTLEILIEGGMVMRHPINGGIQRYALCCLSANHMHLVCIQCGSIRRISCKEPSIDLAAIRKHRFTPAHHCLYIYGLCSKCKRQENNKKDKK